jgi:hypothetical protein
LHEGQTGLAARDPLPHAIIEVRSRLARAARRQIALDALIETPAASKFA